MAKRQSTPTLLVIALFKLSKAMGLIAVGIGALKLLHHDVAETIGHWIDILRVDPDNHFIHGAIVHVLNVTPKQLEAASVGTFIYAALLLTEGTGLLLREHWAEYFTIITTAGLIPLEVYEIARHLTVVKIVVLLVNVAIVIYLIARVRRPLNTPIIRARAAGAGLGSRSVMEP
jgi:uncharacterized membrane protein (DUF2068 family)